MTTVGIALVYRGVEGTPVVKTSPRIHEVITPTSTSQVSTGVREASEYWEVSTDVNIWVKFGTAPVALAGSDFFLPAGATRHFQGSLGDKVAVILG